MNLRHYLMFACLAGATLPPPAWAAGPTKASFSPAFVAKSNSVGDIAGAIDARDKAHVIVHVKVPGQTPASIATLGAVKGARLGSPAAQAIVKREIATAVNNVTKINGFTPKAEKLVLFSTVPAFAAEVTKAQLEKLATDPNVVSIDYDMPLRKLLDQSLPFDGVPAIHTAGATGAGAAVVVIDDGVERTHSFIGEARLISGLEACILDDGNNSCPNGSNRQIGAGAGAARGEATHGTHVAGIVLGSRLSGTPSKGNAPAAKLIPINIFGTSDGVFTSTELKAFEQAETWVGSTNPNKIAAISMSVGGGFSAGACDTANTTISSIKAIVDRLRAKGILTVVAAGNESQKDGMSYPACISSIVSVGAIQRSAAVISSYSNIGSITDLLAPGGEIGNCILSSVKNNGFAQFCGTSMATPQVSGIIAALKSKVSTATADQIENALKTTGESVADQRTGGRWTKPRVRADRALTALGGGSTAPANNNFVNAINITSRNATMQGTNVGANLETNEWRHAGVATVSSSVWWKITPGITGPITIDTLGSSFDTVLAVYSGATSAGNGTFVASNDDATVGVLQSRVTFTGVAGTTYHIAVAGFNASAVGNIALRVSAPAVNDNFPGITAGVNCCGPVGSASGNNFLTTKQTGEPAHAGVSSATTSVWVSFQATVSGPLTLDTRGSDFDTVLAVYTGGSVGGLTAIASNDDIVPGNLQSEVTFNAVAGQTYRVAIAGYNGLQGNWRINWSLPGAFSLSTAGVQSLNAIPITNAVD